MKIIDTINKKYNEYLEKKVVYYRALYKFSNETTSHNNTSDAFKHIFSSAKLTIWFTPFISKILTDNHEWNNLENGSPVDESIMDFHNNKIGREIGKKYFWSEKKMVEKVLLALENNAITSLFDHRLFMYKNNDLVLFENDKDIKRLKKYIINL